MSGPWIAAFVVLWILVLVLSALVLGLLRRGEGGLTAAESRASSLNPSPKFGLRPGQIVRAFVGYDRADKVVDSIELFDDGPAVVLFVEPGCRPCLQLVSELSASNWTGKPDLIVISPDVSAAR